MTVTVDYYVRFGSGDCSDTLDWEIELTPEEEEIWQRCMEDEEGDLDPNDELPGVLSRAYDEILAAEKENMKEIGETWRPGYSLEVYFDI